MREKLHKLLDMVLDASEQGIDLALDIRPLTVIGVSDASDLDKLYLKSWSFEGNVILGDIVKETKEYIKNYTK